MIREVQVADAAAIAGIYNWYVVNSTITFEEEEVNEAEMAERIMKSGRDDPWLVLEQQGELLGYAYATSWKPRAAYRNSRETSVYLRQDHFGKGYGSLLMQNLIDALRESPVHVLIAGIALPNDASIALHEKLGFHKIGQFEEVGRKFGNYVDVGYWQLTL